MCGVCVLLPHTLLLLCNTYNIPWTNALNKGAMHCQISQIKFELANTAFGVGTVTPGGRNGSCIYTIYTLFLKTFITKASASVVALFF